MNTYRVRVHGYAAPWGTNRAVADGHAEVETLTVRAVSPTHLRRNYPFGNRPITLNEVSCDEWEILSIRKI